MKTLINEFDQEYPDQPVRYVDLEKQMEEHGSSYDDIYGTKSVATDSFESGTKSQAAKEFH